MCIRDRATLDKISQRLDTLATRTDVDQIKVEVKNLTQTFIEKLEKLEGRLLDTETKTDKTEAEVKAEKKKTEILTDSVKQQERRLRQTEREQNDLQQYTRRWNPQVYKVPEDKQRLQTTVYRRYAVSSATKSASQSTLLTSRWLTGWDSGVPVNAADIEGLTGWDSGVPVNAADIKGLTGWDSGVPVNAADIEGLTGWDSRAAPGADP